jgi:hypothetical protein
MKMKATSKKKTILFVKVYPIVFISSQETSCQTFYPFEEMAETKKTEGIPRFSLIG